jgi:hypothetical protein
MNMSPAVREILSDFLQPRRASAPRGCRDSHVSRRRRGAAKATEAAAPEATEAATAAPRRIAGTPSHGYEATREAAMAAFAKSWRREE